MEEENHPSVTTHTSEANPPKTQEARPAVTKKAGAYPKQPKAVPPSGSTEEDVEVFVTPGAKGMIWNGRRMYREDGTLLTRECEYTGNNMVMIKFDGARYEWHYEDTVQRQDLEDQTPLSRRTRGQLKSTEDEGQTLADSKGAPPLSSRETGGRGTSPAAKKRLAFETSKATSTVARLPLHGTAIERRVIYLPTGSFVRNAETESFRKNLSKRAKRIAKDYDNAGVVSAVRQSAKELVNDWIDGPPPGQFKQRASDHSGEWTVLDRNDAFDFVEEELQDMVDDADDLEEDPNEDEGGGSGAGDGRDTGAEKPAPSEGPHSGRGDTRGGDNENRSSDDGRSETGQVPGDSHSSGELCRRYAHIGEDDVYLPIAAFPTHPGNVRFMTLLNPVVDMLVKRNKEDDRWRRAEMIVTSIKHSGYTIFGPNFMEPLNGLPENLLHESAINQVYQLLETKIAEKKKALRAQQAGLEIAVDDDDALDDPTVADASAAVAHPTQATTAQTQSPPLDENKGSPASSPTGGIDRAGPANPSA